METVESLATELIDGSYQLVSLIAEGGNGVVYRAEHLKMSRTVAVKFLNSDSGNNSTELQRFQREMIATGMLNHNNIAQTLGAGLHNGRFYLVMEFVEGVSLRDLLAQEGKLSLQRALRITEDICAGLQHAHQHGVIHRDVKPGNIMIAIRNGVETAVLMDFGIARLLPQSGRQMDTITDSVSVVGSPMYMSPEQGAKREITTRTDIYSLGCVVFEMLAGQPPFCGSSAYDTMFKHLYEPAPELNATDITIPKHVSDAVFRAMEKDPLDRFATVSDFSDALTGRATNLERAKSARQSARLALVSAALLTAASLIFVLLSSTSSTTDRTDNHSTGAQGDSLALAQFNYLHNDLAQCEKICRRLLVPERKRTDDSSDSNQGEIFGTLVGSLNGQRKYLDQIAAWELLSEPGFKSSEDYAYMKEGSIAGAEHLLGRDESARKRIQALLPKLRKVEYKYFSYIKLGDTYLRSDRKQARKHYIYSEKFLEGTPGSFWYEWKKIELGLRMAVCEVDAVTRAKIVRTIRESIKKLELLDETDARLTLDLAYDCSDNLKCPEEAKMLQKRLDVYLSGKRQSGNGNFYERFAN